MCSRARPGDRVRRGRRRSGCPAGRAAGWSRRADPGNEPGRRGVLRRPGRLEARPRKHGGDRRRHREPRDRADRRRTVGDALALGARDCARAGSDRRRKGRGCARAAGSDRAPPRRRAADRPGGSFLDAGGRGDRPTAGAGPRIAPDDWRRGAGNAGKRDRPAPEWRSGGGDVGDLRQGRRGEPPADRTPLVCDSRRRWRTHAGSTCARPPRRRAAPGDRFPNGSNRGAAVLFACPAPCRGPPRPRPDLRNALRTDARATAGRRMRSR